MGAVVEGILIRDVRVCVCVWMGLMIQQQRYMYIWGLVKLWGLAGSRCAVLASAGIHGLGRVIRNDKGQENRKEAGIG